MNDSPQDGIHLPEGKGQDRRVHQRRAITPRLYVLLGGSGTDGILNDLSEGGVALDIVGSEPPGEYVDVDFEMPELGRHFEAKGRVTWRDESTKKVGVTFIDLPEAARDQIKQWLAMKAASPAAAQRPTVVIDADREVTLNAQPSSQRAMPVEPVVEAVPVKPQVESSRETNFGAAISRDLDPSGQQKDDQLVQDLIASFSATPKKPDNKYAEVIATWSQHSSGWHRDAGPFSAWGYWRWVAVGAVTALAVLLALGVAAHRLPWGNAATINVSKVGQSPSAAGPDSQTQTAENFGKPGDAGNTTHNEIRSGQEAGDNPPNSATSAPTLPPALASSLSKTGQSPCINLGLGSGKIRIYLWSEKDTPPAIVATYAKNLRAVQDVQLVDKAPYDLVLYINGAQVKATGSEAGFMWSSRVFRPWYCGQSLGLLEQTEVNESLHYVQVANLDQRIQAEVAYLILHTFESIRSEHQK
jgi:PilZ domain